MSLRQRQPRAEVLGPSARTKAMAACLSERRCRLPRHEEEETEGPFSLGGGRFLANRWSHVLGSPVFLGGRCLEDGTVGYVISYMAPTCR